MSLLRIEKLEVYKITGPATVWTVRNGDQDVIYATIASGSELVVGPFINIINFNIEGGTVEQQSMNFETPVPLINYTGIQVVNVTPGVNIVVQPGTVLNQRIGYKDNTYGCATHNVELVAYDSTTIEGEASIMLDTDGVYAELVWDGIDNWRRA